ncbi:hypothetical protein OIV83_001610 [Microbotryomycetes sp. JL201]|nr:hypothetical protein OIV83_001610 [Microbotryomycetes sp. JL201]
MWPFSRNVVLPTNGALDSRPDRPEELASAPDPNTSASKDGSTKNWAALLEPFNQSQLPTKARTEPHVKQKESEPIKLGDLWQYPAFLAVQGASLVKAFANHHIYGPPKPSWGVELTLFTSMLREVAAYSHLSSVQRLRSVLELGSLLPAPKDGIVTPISFRVKRRGLRGFLAEADAAEDGKRTITGEWVINKRLWRKMQAEFALRKTVPQNGRVILYLHGGAYFVMSTQTHRFLTISVSRYTESRVFAINYRLAPETKFPGQLHDAVSAYMRLIIDLKIPPENIIFAGDSAGGGLAMATMIYLRDEGYPLPSGAVLMSPWVDLTMSCESWTTNREFDYLPSPKSDDPFNPVKCLLGENINKWLTHPYVSPLFGDMSRLPPMLIQAGDAEVLRDEITLLAHKASLAGVAVEHEIFEDCVHVFQAFIFLEASRKALQSMRHFVKHKLPNLNKPKDVDFAQIDADIAADAHQVDQQGNAEPTSLPASPTMEPSDLPPSDGDSDSEVGSERDGVEQAGIQTDSSMKSAGKASSPPPAPPGGHHTQRPILRAYASARDLGMSQRRRGDSTASPSSPKSLPGDLTSSSSSTTSTRRHRQSSAAIAMSTREETIPRIVHARSSSHPDLRALIDDYTAHGPSNPTRVYGPSASGHATPESSDGSEDAYTLATSNEEPELTYVPPSTTSPLSPHTPAREEDEPGVDDIVDEDEVVAVVGKRKTNRTRSPSWLSNKSSTSGR